MKPTSSATRLAQMRALARVLEQHPRAMVCAPRLSATERSAVFSMAAARSNATVRSLQGLINTLKSK